MKITPDSFRLTKNSKQFYRVISKYHKYLYSVLSHHYKSVHFARYVIIKVGYSSFISNVKSELQKPFSQNACCSVFGLTRKSSKLKINDFKL